MLIAAIIIVAVLAIVDALVTERALALGRRERNRFLRRALGSRPQIEFALAWRFSAVGVLAWLFHSWGPRHGWTFPWYGWAIIAVLQLAAIAKMQGWIGGER